MYSEKLDEPIHSGRADWLSANPERGIPYFSSCACAEERGRGKGRKTIRLVGFRSVCHVGRANEIRAFKVIEYGYIKST